MSTSEPGPGSQAKAPPHPNRQTWDTSYVRRKDRFDYFRESVCQAFLSMSPERPPTGEISARVSRIQVQTGWLARFDSSQHSQNRTKADRAKMADDYLMLSLQVSGSARMEHDDGIDEFERERGNMSLIALNHYHRITIKPGDQYVSLGLIFDPKRLGGRRILRNGIIGQRDFAEALMACFRILNSRYASGAAEEFDRICEATLALTAASMLMDREFLQHEASERSAIRHGLLAAIKSYVVENLADRSLSPVVVASRFGISVRYVHKMFEKDGTTFGRFVLARRLECAYADLSAPVAARSSVSEVARRWGFGDVSAFHRGFKTFYGDSPGKIRTIRIPNV